ncbi:competence protein J (ComJ) [Pseudomonas sp. SJZ103]|uniref:competence protein ComJ n=1 Tax=unclassified Pseudomonas TaxID=196821 RepID=UPI0011A55BE3|nr:MULTISPECIES: competence protein ComJ [unclassified Pseudomonas]TWC73749.1 competence protein J (ComJ) [Pseudomonas sp. SJZ103]TWC83390.1 competence protein J (ComJ) [Pseudomonas sp. SJZ094]
MKNTTQSVDLLISHRQIQFRSRPFDEASSQWGKVNLAQGAVLHSDYVVFDPLPEDAFGANVNLNLTNRFTPDETAQRCIVVPFHVTDPKQVEVASASEKFNVKLDLEKRDYALYFEVCEGDEIFYKITLVPTDTKVAAKYLLDDPWGGEKDQELVEGIR